MRFCGLHLSLRQISSSSEFFGFVSNVVASPLRLDVSIQLFLSPRISRWISEGGEGIYSRDPNPFCTPSKIFGGGLDLSSSERRLRNDFIGSLTGSPIAIPVAYRNEDL